MGRLLNLMKHDHQEWDDLLMLDMKYLVIDEADYFLTGPKTKDILQFLENERLPPANQRQNLYFSPTLRTERLELLADEYSNVSKMVFLSSSLECNQRIKFIVENIPSANNKPEMLQNCVKKIIAENDGKCPRIMVFTNIKVSFF
uniref:Helicase ATP-binding domain-containing protein n=1 Tax=Panagrolaimus superbus TaxID=310955 RepID=A0A914YFB1_9BILA